MFAEYLTPENLAKLVTAVAAAITAVGGLAIFNGRKEKKKGEGPSQFATLKQALDLNTSAQREASEAIQAQHDLFLKNIEQVDALKSVVTDLNREARSAVGIARNVEHKLIEIAARRN